MITRIFLVLLFFGSCQFVYAQGGLPGNLRPAGGSPLGWTGGFSGSLEIRNNFGGQPINFFTGPAQRMVINGSGGPSSGFIGIGNNFTAPTSLLHLNTFGSGTGDVLRTDGNQLQSNRWQMFTGTIAGGLSEKGVVFASPFVNTQVGQAPFNHFNIQATQGDVVFNARGFGVLNVTPIEVMRVTRITLPAGGTQGRVSIGANGAVVDPLAMLHIGGSQGAFNTQGHRPWMQFGTYVSLGTDNMYVGMRSITNDRADAIINWGNNPNTNPLLYDKLRFVFTAAPGNGTASGLDGLEIARMISDGNNGRMGIGDFFTPNVDPQNTLEVRASASSPYWANLAGTSGLRLTFMVANAATQANPGSGVLSVDSNGDVIYVPDAPGFPFGGVCGNLNAMTSDFEIPMGTSNFVFTGQGVGVTSVGIGTLPGTCTPLPAKLVVNQSNGALNSISILGRNADPSSCAIMAINVGIGGTSTNPQVGGWFQTVPDQYAVVVPKNGGFVSIGYATTVVGPAFSWNGTFTTAVPSAMVDVAGSIYMGGQLVNASDVTLKHNVQSLDNPLDKVLQLQGINFEWNVAEDSSMAGTHAGFIAQQVDTVIPEVVHTNSNGIKSIAYTELIPYLVEALKEEHLRNDSLEQRLDSLTQAVGSCCNNNARLSDNTNQQDVTLTDSKSIVLNQNVPNPFAEQTTISFLLPESVVKAQMLFYDAQGKLIKAVDLEDRGAGQLNVFADDLSNGVYTYTLIADGQVIDTRQMVKSK